MLLAVQFPLCDLRSFIPNTNRLPVPPWPLVAPNRDFVRSCGIVRRRPRGGIDVWSGEEAYAEASGALRFPMGLRHGPSKGPERDFSARCVFRRLLCTHTPTTRLEAGLRLDPIGSMPEARLAQPTLIINWAAQLPVSTGARTSAARALHGAGPQLAAHFLAATTRTKVRTMARWVCAGEPLFVLDARKTESDTALPGARPVMGLQNHGLDLYHARIPVPGGDAPTWVLMHEQGSNRDVARRLRIHLLRLHAERECLRIALRHIATGELRVSHHDATGDTLQRWLYQAAQLLAPRPRAHLPRCAILEAAYASHQLIDPGLQASLWGQLEHIRFHVAQRLRQATRSTATGPQHLYIVKPKELTVHQYNIQFGDHSVVHGDVVVAEQIQNSFNRAVAAQADANMKQELQALAQEVAVLTKQLPPERARETARDLEVLTQEALSASPRKPWYQLAAEGLMAAATAIGAGAQGVVKIVRNILALLG